MTHFIDIDGSKVMAGSPDKLGCAAFAIRQLLGDYAFDGDGWKNPLSSVYAPFRLLEQIPITEDNKVQMERLFKAINLLRDAAELLDGQRFAGVNERKR